MLDLFLSLTMSCIRFDPKINLEYSLYVHNENNTETTKLSVGSNNVVKVTAVTWIIIDKTSNKNISTIY